MCHCFAAAANATDSIEIQKEDIRLTPYGRGLEQSTSPLVDAGYGGLKFQIFVSRDHVIFEIRKRRGRHPAGLYRQQPVTATAAASVNNNNSNNNIMPRAEEEYENDGHNGRSNNISNDDDGVGILDLLQELAGWEY